MVTLYYNVVTVVFINRETNIQAFEKRIVCEIGWFKLRKSSYNSFENQHWNDK